MPAVGAYSMCAIILGWELGGIKQEQIMPRLEGDNALFISKIVP